jgi:hypothetical protein
MHRGRNCPRVTAQFLSVDCVIPQFAPVRVYGFFYISVFGIPDVLEFHSDVDAVPDLDALRISWTGPFESLLFHGDFALVQAYDSTTGYNKLVFQANFAGASYYQLLMVPSKPMAWSPVFPVSVPTQDVLHIPFPGVTNNGFDVNPRRYY